jgi:hypothetical protein
MRSKTTSRIRIHFQRRLDFRFFTTEITVHSSLITIHALAFPPYPLWLNLIPQRLFTVEWSQWELSDLDGSEPDCVAERAKTMGTSLALSMTISQSSRAT